MKAKKFQLGLKLWSTNLDQIPNAIKLLESGIYQYIELFAVPGSYKDVIAKWSCCQAPFVIHAAHYNAGMDLSDPTKFDSNKILVKEAQSFADTLSATHIIFHPGVKGNLVETARQLREINDKRLLIENVPLSSIDGKFTLLGSTPAEINSLLTSVPDLGFCLDIVHACCSAYSHDQSIQPFIDEFLKLKPKLFHLADNKLNTPIDEHLAYGTGALPLQQIIEKLPINRMITLESTKNPEHFYQLAASEAHSIYAC